MNKFIMIAISALALSACSPHKSGQQLAASSPVPPHVASEAELSEYARLVKKAVEKSFTNIDAYRGKACDLHIRLAPDGMLLDVKATGGDPALCQAAVKAVAETTFPAPKNDGVYQVFKNAPLDFRP